MKNLYGSLQRTLLILNESNFKSHFAIKNVFKNATDPMGNVTPNLSHKTAKQDIVLRFKLKNHCYLFGFHFQGFNFP